jgi:hypothetical protein
MLPPSKPRKRSWVEKLVVSVLLSMNAYLLKSAYEEFHANSKMLVATQIQVAVLSEKIFTLDRTTSELQGDVKEFNRTVREWRASGGKLQRTGE